MVDYSKWDNIGSSDESDHSDTDLSDYSYTDEAVLHAADDFFGKVVLSADPADATDGMALLSEISRIETALAGVTSVNEAFDIISGVSKKPPARAPNSHQLKNKKELDLDGILEVASGDMPLTITVNEVAVLVHATNCDPKSIFKCGEDTGAQVLDSLIDLMNSKEPLKVKQSAMIVIANAAKVRQQRDMVYTALQQLTRQFDDAMQQRVAGRSKRTDQKYNREQGALHEIVLVALLRVTGYKMGTTELLELVGGDLCLALDLIRSAVQVTAYEDELVNGMMKLLQALSQPASFFTQEDAPAPREGEHGRGKLEISASAVDGFSDRINEVLVHSIQSGLITSVIDSLSARFFKQQGRGTHQRFRDNLTPMRHTSLHCLMGFLLNVHGHSTTIPARFKQHLLVAADVAAKILNPYLALALELRPRELMMTKELLPFTLLDPFVIRGLKLTLKLMVVLHFGMPNQLQHARDTSVTKDVLQKAGSTTLFSRHPNLLALLLLYEINIASVCAHESAGNNPKESSSSSSGSGSSISSISSSSVSSSSSSSSRGSATIELIENLLNDSRITSSQLALVRRRLVASGALPVCRSTESYTLVSELMERVCAKARRRESKHESSDEEDGDGWAKAGGSPSGSESKAERIQQQQGQPLHQPKAEEKEGAPVPASVEAKQLTEERRRQSTPLYQLYDDDEHALMESYEGLQGFACGELVLEKPESSAEAKQEQGSVLSSSNRSTTSSSGGGGHLSGLPPLKSVSLGSPHSSSPSSRRSSSSRSSSQTSTPRSERKRHQQARAEVKAEAERETRGSSHKSESEGRHGSNGDASPGIASDRGGSSGGLGGDVDGDTPKNFLCSINGHVMQQPVRSPHGHTFESSTIERWIGQQGSICPHTGKHLQLVDLQPDQDLRADISRWLIQRTMEANTASELDGDDDLYDF
jgi:hypothetical protein